MKLSNCCFSFLILPLSFFIISCTFQPPSLSGNNDNQQNSQVKNASLAQNLPIGATLLINNEKIELEIAQTPEQQQIGLMYRSYLPINRGMLFPFSPPQTVSFWMKNVSIPLDIIFVSEGIVKYIAKALPCDIEPCSLYNSTVIIDQVIELAGGRTEELNINVGDRLQIDFLPEERKKN